MSGTETGEGSDSQPKGAVISQQHVSERQDAGGPRAKARLVLIAEDEQPIAEALAYIVEDCGYVALRVANGQEALAFARAHHPDVVITDLMMPLMDGGELIAALHADAKMNGHAPPPIILTTAGGYRHAEGLGADVVLSKPFEVEQIERLLRRFLEQPRGE